LLRDWGASVSKKLPPLAKLAARSQAQYGEIMNARDEIVDFLVDQIPTSALAGFQPSSAARQRIWHLIAKEKDTGLLPEEKLELDDYMKLEHLLVLAKAKARLAQKNV
jgi:hypothetical protein